MQIQLPNAGNTYSSSKNGLKWTFILLAGISLILCLIQLYFMFVPKKDLLAGFGFITTAADPLDKVMFYASIAIVCGAIAAQRGLSIIAVVFGFAFLANQYGKTFYIEDATDFNLDSLPTVNASFGAGQTSQKAAPTPKTTTNPAAKEWMNKMADNSYTRTRPLTKPERDWCFQDKDENGIPNGRETFHAKGNCTTGFLWTAPQ